MLLKINEDQIDVGWWVREIWREVDQLYDISVPNQNGCSYCSDKETLITTLFTLLEESLEINSILA